MPQYARGGGGDERLRRVSFGAVHGEVNELASSETSGEVGGRIVSYHGKSEGNYKVFAASDCREPAEGE